MVLVCLMVILKNARTGSTKMLQKQSGTTLVFLDSLMGHTSIIWWTHDYNHGLHHGICYSMLEVIYNATSSKAKEYKTCCRSLQQDPDEDTKRTLEERILTPPVNNNNKT